MMTVEIPISEWINNYPFYVDSREEYFKFRPFFTHIPENSIGVEIGTFEGYNALGICRYCNPKKLYLIDPYLVYDSPVDTNIWKQEDWENIFERAKKKLEEYPVEFIRKPSTESANKVPNGLDFVYIDGDHRYESVIEDIRTWYPKIKNGGLLGGHDLMESGVKDAVTTFVYSDLKNNPTLTFRWNDWWITKQN